jgi:hypothetical protein
MIYKLALNEGLGLWSEMGWPQVSMNGRSGDNSKLGVLNSTLME